MDGNILYLSVVIPFYNEEESVRSVCSEVSEVLTAHEDLRWELLMVDDGSTDRTPQIVDELSRGRGSFQALHLSPNSGQSAAFEAGFRAARGEMVATLDGDGQNDPGDIISLIEKMNKNQMHMMCGIRRKRSDNVVRRLSSIVANKVRSAVLDDGITDVGCSLRVFRRDCLEHVRFFRNAHRFFPALFKIAGFSVGEMPVNHRPRKHGESKYGGGINSRLWVGIVDLAGVYWLSRRAFSYTVNMKQ